MRRLLASLTRRNSMSQLATPRTIGENGPEPVDSRHTSRQDDPVERLRWSHEKNQPLQQTRGISFEEVAFRIERDEILDVRKHPNEKRYPSRKATKEMRRVLTQKSKRSWTPTRPAGCDPCLCLAKKSKAIVRRHVLSVARTSGSRETS